MRALAGSLLMLVPLIALPLTAIWLLGLVDFLVLAAVTVICAVLFAAGYALGGFQW